VQNLLLWMLIIHSDNMCTTIPMRCSLLESCKERGDHWASEVENRPQGCFDLVAAEAMYHDKI